MTLVSGDTAILHVFYSMYFIPLILASCQGIRPVMENVSLIFPLITWEREHNICRKPFALIIANIKWVKMHVVCNYTNVLFD